MENCDTVRTPVVEQAKLRLDLVGKPVNHTDYRSMIGSLMYVTSSRPDIMFATCMCARYQANPNEHHVSAVKRIFRYIKGTINLGFWYPKDSGFDLTAYSDYGFFYDKVLIYYDSKSAITISCNPVQYTRTKHIDVRTGIDLPRSLPSNLGKLGLDYPIWQVIQNGNGPIFVITYTNVMIKVLPPKTAKEDANQKFLRSLPSSWSQVALTIRTKPGLDTLSFDDLYNNLRVFERDVKGTTASSSSNSQNVTFVYADNTSSTNYVSTANSVSSHSVSKSQKEGSTSCTDEVIHSFFANQSSDPQLDCDCWVIIIINPLNLSTVSFGVDAALDLEEKH
nr:uncharacterized mitochondrial protein AtMg00810-like [Tanacetum cinerariifolium]